MPIGYKLRTSAALAACAALTAAVALTATPAAAATNFFAGKTLTMIVPYGPGGGYDRWVRLLAPVFKAELGLAQVRVENRPGGGGLVGTDALYMAKPDGLTIGDTNGAGDLFSQMAGAAGVRFKSEKLNWIGRPDDDPDAIAVHPSGPYKTFDDMIALKGTKKVFQCLATGKGSSSYNGAVITLNAFSVPFRMVAAFRGSHQLKATFVTGDGDGATLSISDFAELGPDKQRVVIVMSAEPSSMLPGAPTVIQEGQKHHLSKEKMAGLSAMAGVLSMGHAFVAPPGVPADRLQALRAAFAKAFKNKSFVAKAKKAHLYVGYASAQKLQEWADLAFKNRDVLTPLLKTP